MTFHHALGLLVAVGLASLSGCSTNTGRQPISGSVQFQGKPMATGEVKFFRAGGNKSWVGSAPVHAGRFNIPAAQGLDPGTYVVQFSATVPGGERTPEMIAAGASTPAKQIVPAKYNIESQLTIDVKSGEKNEFEFNLD